VFIGVRIIKEIPGSVASGTPCISKLQCNNIGIFRKTYAEQNCKDNFTSDVTYQNVSSLSNFKLKSQVQSKSVSI